MQQQKQYSFTETTLKLASFCVCQTLIKRQGAQSRALRLKGEIQSTIMNQLTGTNGARLSLIAPGSPELKKNNSTLCVLYTQSMDLETSLRF